MFFEYILPAFTACIAMLIMGPYLIPLLRKMKFGQEIREDGPQWHAAKSGTPTMGGLMIFAAILLSLLISHRHWSRDLFVGIGTIFGFGMIGFIDDGIKIIKKRNLGLNALPKFLMQTLVACAGAYYIIRYQGSILRFPFTSFTVDLGWWYFPILVFVFLATVNSFNLTDGLDGLSSSVGTVYFAAMALIFAAAEGIADKDMAVLAAACAGALLGFLRFNTRPARVMMGDVGSLAMGGAVAYLAISGGLILWLPIMAGTIAISSVSDILQLWSLRFRRRRMFKMAPLHHHLEIIGMEETRIVSMYTIVTVILCLIGLMAIGW